jgi:hypothetical protein
MNILPTVSSLSACLLFKSGHFSVIIVTIINFYELKNHYCNRRNIRSEQKDISGLNLNTIFEFFLWKENEMPV